MAKKTSRQKIVDKLDKVFSEYIRRRYAKDDIAECVTCKRKDHWKNLQAGHFMSRKHYSTRWDEDNVQVQCNACNVFRYGEQYKFSIYLGDEKSKELYEKSRKIVKYADHELEEMHEFYRKAIAELK